MSEATLHTVLIGDVGGTNIRLQLTGVDISKDAPVIIYKKEYLKVEDYKEFHHALEAFLEGVEKYPEVAVLGMAGPIFDSPVAGRGLSQ